MSITTKRLRALVGLALAPLAAWGQVVTDGSVGAIRTLTGPNIGIPDSLGLRMGTNLLHSFSTFNVRLGESAIFTGFGGIENIIARITGGTASTIQGTLRSTIPNSNLFLVNPSGIVFGPNAAINVPGSFHASTAHYLKLADGTRIEMRASPGVMLTSAPPSAFGFEGTAAPIALSGAQLRVAEGRRLSLSGGDIWMGTADNGRVSVLSAPSGTIAVAAAQSAGEAVLDDTGFRAQGFGAMGRFTMLAGAQVTVNEGPARRGAGAISIAGGDILIDRSNVESRTVFQAGRGVRVDAAGSLVVEAGNVLSVTGGAGAAGAMAITGRDITFSNGSLIDTSCNTGCTATASGGALSVSASRSLTLLGNNAALPTFLVSNSFGGGPTGAISIRTGALAASGNAFIQGISLAGGDGSSITIASETIALTGGAQVDASTRGTGRGGTIAVVNAGDIRIEGTRIANATSGLKNPSGFFTNTEGSGNAGQIVISTANLSVLAGGEVSSTARARSTGAGGRIAVTASGAIRVSGADADGKSSSLNTNTFGPGNAGEIDLVADALEVSDRGRIQAQTEGAGQGGAIRIRGRTMALSGQGQVSSDARSTGNGGTIDVALTEDLTIAGANSGLFAKTYGPARGGSIRVAARDVFLRDGGGIYAGADLSNFTGQGGDIVVSARDIDIATDGSITAETKGAGRGGTVDVTASRALTLADGGSITSQTENTGAGGTVAVRANTIDLRRDGRISAEAISLGTAGNVAVAAADSLVIAERGRITTSAPLSDGGDVLVAVGRFAYLDGGRITTAVGAGQGAGGNIDFRVPTLLMNDGTITANAFGGPGGNIRIGTTTFVPSAGSKVTASSTLGVDGTITLESPALDPSGELLLPPAAFTDAGAILAGRCGPRLAGRASSLVVAPAAAFADAPDGWRWRAAADAAWSQPLACVVALAAAS